MRFTFRLKLLTIVGSAALAFVLLTVASTLISNQVEQQMATIEESYVPRLELGPQLERQFEGLRRAFQDAVAAQDTEGLDGTRGLRDTFLETLASARNAVNPADAAQLREAVQDYYAAAHDVSHRLIAGETGEALVDGMESMQAKQNHAADLLRTVTAFDKQTLTEAFTAARRAQATATRLRLLISIGCLAVVLALSLWVSRSVLRSLAELTAGFERYGRGEFSEPLRAMSHDELGEVAEKANQMAANLQRLREERDAADWLKTGQAGLAHELRGELEPVEAANRVVRFLARHLDAPVGALYSYSDGEALQLLGQYARSPDVSAGDAVPTFRMGEGLVGQAALQEEVTVISEPPAEYLRIHSGLGEAAARVIVLLPLLHAGKVTGVLELGLFKPWSDLYTELLLSVRETAAIAIEVARARAAVGSLLAETRQQSQRLATQEEELRVTNEELQAQQEELTQSNEELTQQTEELEAQRRFLEQKNAELKEAQRALEQKAKDLTTVSAYKSQFLANMSHELRTPLNSMLLLSNLLADNDGRNLTDKQVEYAKTIYGAGNDLLALINQVLDLARIESGKQDLRIESVPLRLLVEHAERVFAPLARDKGLAFSAELAPGLTDTILTDRQRVEQIVTNLLGNAIKFTERGRVELRVRAPAPGARFRRGDLRADRAVAFVVSDTGIGIAPEDQVRIFTPFEQIEARSDRRYGGTGLGLSITHELASRLGGEVHLESGRGTGSTFLCYLPFEPPAAGTEASAAALGVTDGQSLRPAPAPFARAAVESEGVGLLIIEDDAR